MTAPDGSNSRGPFLFRQSRSPVSNRKDDKTPELPEMTPVQREAFEATKASVERVATDRGDAKGKMGSCFRRGPREPRGCTPERGASSLITGREAVARRIYGGRADTRC